MEQIHDEARGRREEALEAEGVFQSVFHMFHISDEAIAGGAVADMLPSEILQIGWDVEKATKKGGRFGL